MAVYQAIKVLVSKKEYLKLWEMARKGIVDKVVTIRKETVGIAMEISKHGVRSCLEEVRGLREDDEEEVRAMFM